MITTSAVVAPDAPSGPPGPASTRPRARLDRALAAAAALQPEAAAAATTALGKILAWTEGAGAGAWSSSRLARDGYPVELGFVPGVPGLRYTAEVTAPAVAPAARLDRALELAEGFGARVRALEWLERLRRLQADSPDGLRYGTWLSGRHRPRRSGVESRYKLYVEIPAAAGRERSGSWVEALLGSAPAVTDRAVTLRMVGLDLVPEGASPDGPTRIELYHDLTWLHPTEIATLAGRVGLADRAQEALELLRDAACLPLQSLPADHDWGFSYALRLDGTNRPAAPEAFTLYTFANALFGGDAKIRRTLLALGRRRGWDLSLYERVSAPLVDRRGFITCHGVFGATVTAEPDRPAAATFGTTPPPISPREEAVR